MISNEQAETLNRLFEDGYLIQILEYDQEVDVNVTMIENLGTEEEPEWIYTNEFNDGTSLRGKYLNEIRVYARVDWALIINSENYISSGECSKILTGGISLQDYNDDLDNAYDESGD